MKKPNNLTPLEWELMNVIWKFEQFPVTVRQVLEKAYPEGEKAYTTVQTIMNHLVEKEFLARKKIGPVNVYSPRISAEELQSNETQRFVQKVFGGSFFSLANFLLSSDRLTQDELARLKAMLNEKSEEHDHD